VGKFKRSSEATATGAQRSVEITDCPIIRCSDSNLGDGVGREMTVRILETETDQLRWKEDDPERIGALTRERSNEFYRPSMRVSIFIPSKMFAEIWKAAEAKDRTERKIRFEFKQDQDITDDVEDDDDSLSFTVTGATLHRMIWCHRARRQGKVKVRLPSLEGPGGGARTLDEQTASSGIRTSGSAVPDSDGPVPHEPGARGGSSGSADRRHAGRDIGPPAHSRRHNRSDRGRSSCK
jgi:hypothetical protein